MQLLLIGSGGREHALAWALSRSPQVSALYSLLGNGGIHRIAQPVTVPADDFAAIADWCKAHSIDYVVVGPEAPLVEGIADVLEAAGIKVFGPSKAASQLEGSKHFTKEICFKYGIPTAASGSFTDAKGAKAYIRQQGAPIVVKADGLAAGKGVIMAETEAEALEAVDTIFEGKFGAAGRRVVIEEWLIGEEASFFAVADGEHVVAIGAAQDHKRIGEGDTGPNTGGMGTYSPTPALGDAQVEEVMETIIRPTV
ncbi:MAG: phosphoribosylamine--glycine ligase, partial [Rickettsiales bacterium]|nr:phosphoribosylamine--glycine ligase [Rickettsiales bacterium]